MAYLQLAGVDRQADFASLKSRLLDYSGRVDDMTSPDEVLDELHAVTFDLSLSVLGAARFPLQSGDWGAIQLGKSAFLHRSVPTGWWDEYDAVSRGKFRPVLFLAVSSMGAHTWTEVLRLTQPVGIDRWWYELGFKHGMRDGLTCPVGGRWAIGFWSRKELSSVLTRPLRIMIFTAASFAALRLQQIIEPDPGSLGERAALTPRELAVLRLVSTGAAFREVAQDLRLGEETVRSHRKKAQAKLGVRNRTHAVAEAVRKQLIP